MSRTPLIALWMALSLSLLLPAQENPRITTPPTPGAAQPSEWHVDPGRGNLSIAIPIGAVAGEIPIPVAFSMNGTFMSCCFSYFPMSHGMAALCQDYGVHGTLGFGYIGWSRRNWGPRDKKIVLEDGRTYAESDFVPNGGASPYKNYGSALLPSFGITCTPDPFRISGDGSLAWGTIPAASFLANCPSTIADHLPTGFGAISTFDLVADKDRLRVFAQVEALCPSYLAKLHAPWVKQNSYISIPIYWADRFNHSVTFQWTMNTSGLPNGIASLVRVDALNQRNQGVTVRYANWDDNTAPHDLLRSDFVGCEGPSVLMQGYSGPAISLPVGFANSNPNTKKFVNYPLPPYVGGVVARPTAITLGESSTLDQPSWNNSGSFAATSPAPSGVNTGMTHRVWTLGYDENHAALTAMTNPALVETRFASYGHDALYEDPKSHPMESWTATQVVATDISGKSSYARSMTWKRTLPVPLKLGPLWSQPNWTVTFQDGWNLGGTTPPDRTATFTFASPTASRLDYQNMFLQSCSVTDGTNTMATAAVSATHGDHGGGLDSSLSLPLTVTTTRSGENARQVTYGYTDATCLQVQSITDQCSDSGTYKDSQIQQFAYNNCWPMLDGHQVNQIKTTRYRDGVAMTPVVTTTQVWDSAGLSQLQRTFADAGPNQHGRIFTYDADGKLATQGVHHMEDGAILPSPATLAIHYDPGTGQPSSWTTSFQDASTGSGSTSRSAGSFDGAGRPTDLADEKGVHASLTYDLYGRITHSATQGTSAITISYPDPWTVVKTQDAMTTTTLLDGFGRSIGEILADGTQVAYAYGLHGELVSTTKTSPAGTRITSTTSYDLLGRPTSQTAFEGTTVTFSYAAAEGGCNRVIRSYGGAFPTATLTDPFGQVVQVKAATGDLTQKTYDGRGNLGMVQTIAAKDGSRQTRVFTHDALGRLTSRTEPEIGLQTWAGFNALNLPTTMTEAGTRSRTLTYDGLGRLRSRSASANGTAVTESFSYGGPLLMDTARTVTGAATETVAQHFDYYPPAEGARLRSETTTQAGLISAIGYAYTGLGAVGAMTYPSGRVVSYGFDPLGRAISITSSLNGANQSILPAPSASPFDEWSNRSSLVFPSGGRSQWSLDATHARPGSAMVLPKGGNPLAWTYQYDPVTGRLTGTGEWTLQNDSLGRLEQANQNWTLAQDPQGTMVTGTGNLLSATLSHDAFGNNLSGTALTPGMLPASMNNFTLAGCPNNQLPSTTAAPSTGAIHAAYNPCGELESVASGVSSNQYLTMAMDPLGRLTAVSQSLTGAVERYQYAASGLRVARADSLDPAKSRAYAYTSKGQLLGECLNGGAWSREVVYLDDRAVAEIDGTGIHELHSDHLGTPRVVTNAGTGAIEGFQNHGPYGELLSAAGYLPLSGYTGHIQTEPNGLIYMRGRFYSPAWHRFLSSDQGADPSQVNQYAYAGGNPMVNVDPSGMLSVGGLWGDITHGAHQLGHAMGVNWNHSRRPIEIGLAAAATGGYAGAWAMETYLAGIETMTMGNVAAAAGIGMVTGGTVGGGVAGGLSGGNLESAGRGALFGGTMAAAGAFALGQGMGGLGSALFKGGVGGGLSSAMGGDFSSGFNNGFVLSMASGAYTSFVGTPASTQAGENMPYNQNSYAFTDAGKVPSGLRKIPSVSTPPGPPQAAG